MAWPAKHASNSRGAVYHVLDRGDRREAIFGDDADRSGSFSQSTRLCGRTRCPRIFQQGLAYFGVRKGKLVLLEKGDARKLAIANAIRLNTVVPNAWIAEELKLGHVSRVSRCWNPRVPLEASAGFLAALEK